MILLSSSIWALYSNVIWVVIGTSILGGIAGVIGTFSFLRGRSLVGDAIAHATLPGVCLAFMVSGGKDPLLFLLGAVVTGWLSLQAIDILSGWSKIKPDAAIAAILSIFFGIGIVLLTFIQHSGNAAQSGLDSFLFGNAASLTEQDLITFSTTGIIVLLLVIAFFKEFKVVAFDPAHAQAQGIPVRRFEIMLSTLTVMTVAIGIQTVGVVLMAALLITPASAAKPWVQRLPAMLFLAFAVGAVSGILGSLISFTAPSMPTGPWIVVSLSLIAIGSLFLAPGYGIIPKMRARERNHRKILNENILKAFYHLGEANKDLRQTRDTTELLNKRPSLRNELRKGLKSLEKQDQIQKEGEKGWRLTEKGEQEAARIVRLHRLWELYLTKRVKLGLDRIHSNAEAIEHVITPEVEAALEEELGYPEKDPHHSHIPRK